MEEKTKVGKTTILDEEKDKAQRVISKEFVAKLYHEDKATYNAAVNLVNKLILGDMWRDFNLAVMHTAKALSSQKCSKCGSITKN
jgi:hypothetical protein